MPKIEVQLLHSFGGTNKFHNFVFVGLQFLEENIGNEMIK